LHIVLRNATDGCDIVAPVVPDSIAREIVIDAPPERVWAIVTEAQHMAGWFSDEVEIDLRPGGAMLLTWHRHGSYQGRVDTVDPPRTFAFRWLRREDAEGSTRVVMTLTPEGDATRLRVVESGFGDLAWPEDERTRHAEENRVGWGVELDELRAYAER
jgi:uncharacterized protein YndB with AHSA1/START domain